MLSAKHGFALVTPASRGLGFALAQQLLEQTQLPIIATGRKNCFEIRERLLSGRKVPANAEERLRLLEVDVTGRGKTKKKKGSVRMNGLKQAN